MPQMAPMGWFMLFSTFCLTLMIFVSLNYFIFIYKNNSKFSTKKENLYMNWKW
uniref:ATP synthase complex subunit 8 n=1 Tax=Elateroidea sp. BMNH 1274768 TaxID=1796502 RepID=A0A140EGH7_9COLE|nr:ATP synthase F0 subunit 8 [Elateroidea sp. BMNH 1274768]